MGDQKHISIIVDLRTVLVAQDLLYLVLELRLVRHKQAAQKDFWLPVPVNRRQDLVGELVVLIETIGSGARRAHEKAVVVGPRVSAGVPGLDRLTELGARLAAQGNIHDRDRVAAGLLLLNQLLKVGHPGARADEQVCAVELVPVHTELGADGAPVEERVRSRARVLLREIHRRA